MRQEGIPIMRRIKPISDKRRRDKLIYGAKRRDFLAANPWCEWARKIHLPKNKKVLEEINLERAAYRLVAIPAKLRATQVHHTRGRWGSLYLNDKFWKAVSSQGHDWIHENLEAARKLGLLCKRGDWGKQT